MSDPVTLSYLMYAAVAAAGVSAVGAVKSGQAQAAQAKSAEYAADYNAKASAIQSNVATQQAGAEEAQQSRSANLALGREIAGKAESGTDLTSGSSLDLTKQSATAMAQDALNIRYGGQLKGLGYQQQSVLNELDARAAGRASSAALTGGYLNAGAAALSGSGQAYGTYLRAQRK